MIWQSARPWGKHRVSMCPHVHLTEAKARACAKRKGWPFLVGAPERPMGEAFTVREA